MRSIKPLESFPRARNLTTPSSGVVLLDKSHGETSFSALSNLKHRFGTKRVGHTGTLDPMATGLLLVLIGSATRCARFFSSLDKTYSARICFGSETDTDDRFGRVVKRASIPEMESVVQAAKRFVGEISQTPPAYSAIHIGGRRAYQLARAGEEVKIPPRRVVIHDIQCLILDDRTVSLTVRCASGTYVRSLARDIGRMVDSAAHLSALRRTRVGPFDVSEVLARGQTDLIEIAIGDALMRLDGFSGLEVDSDVAETMWNGGHLVAPHGFTESDERLVAQLGGLPVSVGYWKAGIFRYELVFPKPEDAR